MPGRSNGRLRRLGNGHLEPCEECGGAGDRSNLDLVVTWEDMDPDPDDSGPEWCGHQLTYVVTWAGIPEPKGAA
jgi:hypothetical protein